jgi:hypothetical protein
VITRSGSLCIPYAVVTHSTACFGGGVWHTLELDYPRIADILRKANYSGYMNLEMEGRENAETVVPKSLEAMRKALAKPDWI